MVEPHSEIEHGSAPVAWSPPFLLDRVRQHLSNVREDDGMSERFVQIRFPIGRIDPFLWLKEQTLPNKILWQSRASDEIVVGVGTADEIAGTSPDGFSALTSRLEDSAKRVRYYGGMRFDLHRHHSELWQNFGGYRFVLPRFEIRKNDEQTHFVVNLDIRSERAENARVLDELASISIPEHTLTGELPLPISRHDAPSKSSWCTSLSHVLPMLEGVEELRKIVLARQVTFQFTDPIDRYLLLKRLAEATSQCYHFLFEFDKNCAFVGASPERLYRRLGRHVESEAVAGTGLRDQSEVYDHLLGNALLTSDKDQREHAFVRSSILKSFKSLCTSFHLDDQASLMNLNVGRHLRSGFSGLLSEGVSDIDILKRLPPTSAVGGFPNIPALRKIQELEPFDRGWYAGSVGWMSKDAADFAVAIRSGLVWENRLDLFSGAGIVEGSEPEKEWAEIEQKIGDFVSVLGLDQKSAKY